MKKLIIQAVIFLFAGGTLFAQQYSPVDAASSVKFVIKNLGLNVDGSFKGLNGKIIFNPESIAGSSFNVNVDAASINTGNGLRDGHLKKEDYFDVAKYPAINFVSTKITAAGKTGEYNMEGIFTIKGISKSVSFPFTVTAVTNGIVFRGQFKINRRDFNVGGKSWILSDDVAVSLNISTVKQ